MPFDKTMDMDSLSNIIERAVLGVLTARGIETYTPSYPQVPLKSFKAPEAVWGKEASHVLSRIIGEIGTRPLLVVDSGVCDLGIHENALHSLHATGSHVPVFCDVKTEPDDGTVSAIVKYMDAHKPDVLVAMGGGSAMDAAKAAAFMYGREGHIRDYYESGVIPRRKVGLVCLPTTSGSGSEVTQVSVIIDSETNRKMVLSSLNLVPDIAVLDPLLSATLPPKATAACGLDALSHAVEAACNRGANPVTDGIAHAAINIIFQTLPIAVADPGNLDAREAMALGSMLGGMAISNAGVGICHAIAHQIGVALEIPHGVANAILLPHVVRYNTRKAPQACKDLPAAESIHQLNIKTGLPTTLREAARNTLPSLSSNELRSLFDRLADDALNDPCAGGNPVDVPKVDVIGILEAAY